MTNLHTRKTILIVPVEWRGELVTALTIESPLGEEKIAAILKYRRVGSDRKALRKAVAIATDCPPALIGKLFDTDLARAGKMVTDAIVQATEALECQP